MKTDYGKLPKAFKKKWVDALRSGKYKQGSGYLKKTVSPGKIRYCCMGVAAEILGCKVPDRVPFIDDTRRARQCTGKRSRGANRLNVYPVSRTGYTA